MRALAYIGLGWLSIGISFALLRHYIKRREFEAQDAGMVVGKAIGRLSDDELWHIILGTPIPEVRFSRWQRMRRWMRGL